MRKGIYHGKLFGESAMGWNLVTCAALSVRSRGKMVEWLTLGEPGMIEDRSCDALAVIFAADFSPAVCPFVVDPGYAANDYQGVGGVANRATSLSSPALLAAAPVGTLPRSHCKPLLPKLSPALN